MRWVAVSSSSPVASAAVFDGQKLVSAYADAAPMRASGALMGMLRRFGDLRDVEMFVADVGPGSFTGTRVGVTVAKTLAFSYGCNVAGVSSFALIASEGVVAVPARRGSYLMRKDSMEVEQVLETDERLADAIGYGPRFGEQQFPDAKNAGELFGSLVPLRPELIVPDYVLEPNISTPKVPYK